MNTNNSIATAVRAAMNKLATRESVATVAEPEAAGIALYLTHEAVTYACSADFMGAQLEAVPGKPGYVRLRERAGAALRYLDILAADGFRSNERNPHAVIRAGYAEGATDEATRKARAVLRAARAWLIEKYGDRSATLADTVFGYITRLAGAFDAGIVMRLGERAAKSGHEKALSASAWCMAAQKARAATRAPISADQRLKGALDAIALLREHPDCRARHLKAVQKAVQ